MTVANGQTALAADVAALTTSSLALIQADNAALPGVLEQHFYFHDLTAAILAANPERAQVRFIAPYDLLVETVAVETGEQTAASTVTVTVTGNGAVEDWPITVTGTAGANNTKLPRLLFDNTKTAPTSAADFPKTSRAFRVWPKGTEIRVSVSTTSAVAASMIHVVLVLREFYARE